MISFKPIAVYASVSLMESNKYIFESERLGFRKWLPSDAEPFASMNADTEVMEFFPKKLTREESDAFIESIENAFALRGYDMLAVEEKASEDFIGFIGFAHPRFEAPFIPCVEIGWRLDKKYWNKGYATEGAKACLDYGFRTLGFEEVLSFTGIVNVRSERVMQKIGMKKIGEFNHPSVDPSSHVYRHVLYRIRKS
jgi:[ribosomal protein S5]-alanine N-acetyltransferase